MSKLKKAKKNFQKGFQRLYSLGLSDHHRERIREIHVPISSITDQAGNYVGENVGSGDVGAGGQTSAGLSKESTSWGYTSGGTDSDLVGPNIYGGLMGLNKAENRLIKGFQHLHDLPLSDDHRAQSGKLQRKASKTLGAIREDLYDLYRSHSRAPLT